MSDDHDFISSDDKNLNFGNSNSLYADEAFENFYLRRDLKNYSDEALILCRLMQGKWNLAQENKYLRELWEWERSAIKPVIEWLNPAPQFVDLRTSTDKEVSVALYDLCTRLREINQELWYADHLSDRRLYQLLRRDVLPCPIKYLPYCAPTRWDFCSFQDEDRVEGRYDFNWLTYYANDAERSDWVRSGGRDLPPKMIPPYKRGRFPFI